MVEKVWLALRATAFPLFCTVAGASGVYVLGGGKKRGGEQVMNGFAAGVMLAASFFSLLVPAVQGAASWRAPTLGFALGVAGLAAAEAGAAALGHVAQSSCRAAMGIALHNLPEGMVVGLAAALALRGEPDAISGALALALGIGLQNIPEGAAVSLPLAQEGRSKCRAFAAGAASGLVEPLGGLLALALAGWVSAALPWLMSLAAGCMVCVTAQEMIPEAVEADEPAGVISVVAGFALMMALDVAL